MYLTDTIDEIVQNADKTGCIKFWQKTREEVEFFLLKGNEITPSIDLPCKESNARFTTVPLKPLCVCGVQRYVCLNLSKPACI